MTDTMQRGGGLTATQIAWLRREVPKFDEAWQAVKRSDENARRVREKLERTQ